MRYAVLADVHANLPALEAVLDDVAKRRVDAYLVAGDLVGYGPFPNECVERIAALGATCVVGNHEEMLLGRLGEERCITLGRTSLAWTRTVLRDDVRAYLEALPSSAEVEGGLVMAHGTLDHAWEYTTRGVEGAAQLALLEQRHPGAGFLVLGHTHRPFACDRHAHVLSVRPGAALALPDPVLLNPGAVGQSREPRVRARYAVLDTEQRTATFHAVRYDTGTCRAELRRNGLSERSYHLRPTAREKLGRLARAAGVRR